MKIPNLLIVEDDAITAEDLKHQLEEAGYHTTHTTSYHGALDLLSDQEFDLALVDIRLQGEKDGLELGQVLEQKFGLPFVVISASWDQLDFTERSLSTGQSQALSKPVSPGQLKLAVRQALHRTSDTQPEPEAKPLNDAIFVRSGYRLCKIGISDIRFVTGEGRYSTLHTELGRFVQSLSIGQFITQIPHRALVRIHRSYVVNIHHIESIEPGFLRLYDHSDPIPLGPKYQKRLMDLLRVVKAS